MVVEVGVALLVVRGGLWVSPYLIFMMVESFYGGRDG